ncbi:cytochrome b-245 heavy chain-like isoform X2 [Gigantopelta aegis]|nr:cytochrome b-245 heavy chain-like isoform X2 [Gigantopelta aegis]
MLLLLPVCRNLLSFIRGACARCSHTASRQLDKNLTFHRYIAYMICLHTAIHIVAHCFDFERLLAAYHGSKSAQAISNLPTTPNVNPIRDTNTDTTRELFKTVAGISGVVATLALILIVSSSTDIIRRSYFEVFWFTHQLFVLFYLAIIVHGVQGIIRHQINTLQHNPEKCYLNYDKWGSDASCPIPQFAGQSAKTWQWILAPFVLYIIERGLRFFHSMQKVVITKVVKHPSNVFELQLKKSGFSAEPGQYVFLQCPSISQLEWHPFTLTSSPDEDYFSVHVRQVGDWTKALGKACHVDEGEFQQAWKMPKIAVDGPFGTATEDFLHYEVSVLVAGGIGVTPFASALKHIWYKYQDVNSEFVLKKVYLYWICADMHAFEWFQDLLMSMETQMQQKGIKNLFFYNIYLTRGWDPNHAKNIMMHDEADKVDPVTGLQQKTHYGRPQWDVIFPSLVQHNPGVKIGLFFCGPKGLSTELHKLCNRYSQSESTGTKFVYNKENF